MSTKPGKIGLEMISPINNDRIPELQEVIQFGANGIALVRQTRGETITKGDIILEALSIACGHKIEVKEGECVRVVVNNSLETVQSDLFDYVANLASESVSA